MSEEKMRAAFRKLFKYEMSDDAESETFARGYQAALQESEAGAVYQRQFIPGNWKDVTEEEFNLLPDFYHRRIVYPAPQYAQAIETAAIIKCVEVVDRGIESHKFMSACSSTQDESDAHKLVAESMDYAKERIIALIPQDGRTQLEEFGMKVAETASSSAWKVAQLKMLRDMGSDEAYRNELRAIART